MVLHCLDLQSTMDTWAVAMGVLWNMACVLSLCLGYGHGAIWFRFAQHHGLLQRSHESLILVYGKCHGVKIRSYRRDSDTGVCDILKVQGVLASECIRNKMGLSFSDSNGALRHLYTYVPIYGDRGKSSRRRGTRSESG
jgi:hypothetical protein